MQINPSRHRRKVIALRVTLFAAVFAAGWYSPAWTGVNSTKNTVKTSGTKLIQAQTDLARILRTSAGNDRERDLLSWADGLDARTLKDMVAELAAHPSNTTKNFRVMSILLARLAELNPSSALDSLKSVRIHFPMMPGLISTVLDAVSAKGPAEALAAISQLPAGPLRDLAREMVLDNMVDQNPQAALAALRNQPSNASFVFYNNMFREWANNDPSSAAAAALNLPPSNAQLNALEGVATSWAAQDPTGALAWANGLPAGQDKTNAVNNVIQTMSQLDPTAAAAYALQLPGSSNRNQLLINIASNWAQTDPSGALAWADTNLTGDTYLYAVTSALSQIGHTDPAAATAALAQIPDPNVIAKAVPGLATDLAQQDVQTAMKWAQSLSPDNVAVRNSAFSNVLGVWSSDDPAAAAAYLQQNLATDPSFSTLVTQVVNNWGGADPQAALAWAQSLDPGAAQNNAVSAALTQLANVDPQTALNDAQQLSGRSQGAAVVNVINAWSNQNPAAAAAAAQNALNTLTDLTNSQQANLQKIVAKAPAHN